MPDPSKSAGGGPDDWGAANDGSKSSGGAGLCLFMILGFVAAVVAVIVAVIA